MRPTRRQEYCCTTGSVKLESGRNGRAGKNARRVRISTSSIDVWAALSDALDRSRRLDAPRLPRFRARPCAPSQCLSLDSFEIDFDLASGLESGPENGASIAEFDSSESAARSRLRNPRSDSRRGGRTAVRRAARAVVEIQLEPDRRGKTGRRESNTVSRTIVARAWARAGSPRQFRQAPPCCSNFNATLRAKNARRVVSTVSRSLQKIRIGSRTTPQPRCCGQTLD